MTKPSSRRQWLFAAAAAILTGCLSPTMPMPPPSRPEIDGPDQHGVVVLAGRVPLGSWVTADNNSTGLGYRQKASSVTGNYRLPILASIGDRISLFYNLAGEDSSSYEFAIPDYTSHPSAASGAAGSAAGDATTGGARSDAGAGASDQGLGAAGSTTTNSTTNPRGGGSSAGGTGDLAAGGASS